MHYIINGEKKTFDTPQTLDAIMQHLGIAQHVMAVAVNMEVVKKDLWETFMPKDADVIEMLHFVGGG